MSRSLARIGSVPGLSVTQPICCRMAMARARLVGSFGSDTVLPGFTSARPLCLRL
ncbi:hypothetical protein D3C78_1849920 [compost metagenome]